jgi:hypothetical protein
MTYTIGRNTYARVARENLTVNNIKKVTARLKRLQEITLLPDLFTDIPLPFLQQYKWQIA